jgi:hypothetical protein
LGDDFFEGEFFVLEVTGVEGFMELLDFASLASFEVGHL